jgi:hypothetical protein
MRVRASLSRRLPRAFRLAPYVRAIADALAESTGSAGYAARPQPSTLATSARLGNPRAGRRATDRHARTPALAVGMHENGPEAHWYLNTDDLREHKEEALCMTACWQSFALWTAPGVAQRDALLPS